MITRLRRLFNKRNNGGFTLAEVIISTALLGILVIGMLLFMTPVFSMAETSEEAVKADRAVSTMEVYLSKSLRNAIFVKVFTDTNISAAAHNSSAMFVDSDYAQMRQFVADNPNYQLNCISIRYIVDSNPRNQSNSENPYKYMLHNETITAQYTLDGSKSELIFDQGFYEDLYPKFTISHLSVDFDASGNPIPDTPPAGGTPPVVDKTLTPGIVIDIEAFNAETMTTDDKVFTGKSIIQMNNIKSPAINSGGEYKIYNNTAIDPSGGSGKDTFIFFVTRKSAPPAVPPATP